jgi:hypothetical protein
MAMVRALLLKDLTLLRYRMFFGLILVAVTLMPMTVRSPRGMLGAMFTHMVVTAFMMQLGLLEERSRADVLLSLLPVARADVVRARYLLLGGLAAAMATLYVGPVLAISAFVPAPPSGEVLLTWWLWCAAFTLVLWSMSLPAVFRWGTTNSQIVINGVMLVPLLVSMPASRWLGPQIEWLVSQGLLSTVWSGAGALIVAIVLAWLSSLLSTRLYARRDL